MKRRGNWERTNLRCKTVQHNNTITDKSKTVYAIRWADNCVTPDHEVLTSTGWVRFDELKGNETIMQWDPLTREASLSEYKLIKNYYEGVMYSWNKQGHQGIYSPNHRIYTKPLSSDIYEVSTVQELIDKDTYHREIPKYSNRYTSENTIVLSEVEIRLLEAIRADGSYHHGGISFGFRKERKVKRLINLLTNLKLDFSTSILKRGDTYIRIKKHPLISKIISLLTSKKCLGSWVLDLSSENQKALIDESRFWDSRWVTNGSFTYSSQYEEDTILLSTLCHLNGYICNTSITNKGLYEARVQYKDNKITKLGVPPINIDYKGFIYCVQVPTKAFFIRRNGVIWITGNCIMDFVGWFQYDEAKTDVELKRMVKEKYKRNLIVITVDEEWNFWGTNLEMTHAQRLWDTYFVRGNTNDVWTIIK